MITVKTAQARLTAAIRAAQVECDVCDQEMGALSSRTKAYRALGDKLDVVVCRQLALEAALRLFDNYLESCDVIQESTVALLCQRRDAETASANANQTAALASVPGAKKKAFALGARNANGYALGYRQALEIIRSFS